MVAAVIGLAVVAQVGTGAKRPTTLPKGHPATRVAIDPTPPAGERVAMGEGVELFVPEGTRVDRAEGVDLVVHLHGAAWAPQQQFVRSGREGVLVTVTLRGLSSVYGGRFKETGSFGKLLGEAEGALAKEAGKAVKVRRVTVTSFSAGYGGVREFLKDPAAFERIDEIVLADSLHTGFVGDVNRRKLEEPLMEPFVRFAREAAGGRKVMVVSHSEVRPAGYASTTETADYLIRAVGGRRQKVDEPWPGVMRVVSRYEKGNLRMLGFAGEDHVGHLHAIGLLLGVGDHVGRFKER